MKPEIQSHMKVWVAWTNTDCTEGRGYEIPKAVCKAKATAIRLGRKGGVQGSNCRVTEATVVKVDGVWLGPCDIKAETVEDRNEQKRLDDIEAAMSKAKAAGLTTHELALLAWAKAKP